jgi:hypothetical protein
MSKLSELLREPRRRAVDSIAYRGIALLTAHARSRFSSKNAWSARPAAQSEVDAIIDELAARVGVLDLSESGPHEIGILESRRFIVTQYLYEQQNDPSTKIDISIRKQVLVLGSETLLAIDDFIRTSNRFHLRFQRKDKSGVVLKVQFWTEMPDKFSGPSRTNVARNLTRQTVEEHKIFQIGTRVSARALHACPLVLEPEFPIDVVYTWVNDQDPTWRKLREDATGVPLKNEVDDGKSLDRFVNRDELRYSLRSVVRYAPWVRKIYVVTNCAPPAWLDTENDRIEWVDHESVIPSDCLPTFSSHAIESRLQHIPDLSEHFLYFNDDFVLGCPATPGDFFYCNGMSKSFIEGYGSVIGDKHPDDPDYLNAARNGKKLLEADFGRSATSLLKHAPYALRKSVLLEMEERYPDIGKTTKNQFRTIEDISTVSFLYHHYAYLTGRAMYADCASALIKPQVPQYERRLTKILESVDRPLAICLNDGAGSSLVPHWGEHIVDFLDALLPGPCELEASPEEQE